MSIEMSDQQKNALAVFVKLLRANCRIPDENMGDIRAMLASLRTGRLRTWAG